MHWTWLVFHWWNQATNVHNPHYWAHYIAAHAGNGCGAIHSGNWTC